MNKNRLSSSFKFISRSPNIWTVSGLSFVLIGLSFALYLPSMGYYLDDWPIFYSIVVRGAEGIRNYFLFNDRPLGWWPNLIFFKIWGTDPIGWHLTNYLLRWLVGIGIWCVFSRIWQKHKREIFWAVQLFAVYPLFNQQSMGLTFIAHWICYVLFFLSVYLMELAARNPRFSSIFILLGLIVNAANLFTHENFIGFELLRPAILWLAFKGFPKKQQIQKTFLFWLPFFVLTIFYIFWRVFLVENIRGLDPLLIRDFLQEPGKTLIQLIQFILRDTLTILVTVWFSTLNVSAIDLSVPYLLGSMLLTISVIGSLIFFLRKSRGDDPNDPNTSKDTFAIEALVIGLLGVICGLIPGWMINSPLSGSGLWNDRFGFPGMWAAPIFIVGMLKLLFSKEPFKPQVIIIILIGLAVGRNFQVTHDFVESTKTQRFFTNQLKWRAPEIADDTVLLADNELFTKMGVYPTSFMINLIYPDQQAEFIRADHWFLTLNKYFPDNVDELDDGIGIYQQHWYVKFAGWSTNSLVINWNRSGTDCLWVLTANDRYNPLLSDNTRKALGASNLQSILPDSEMPWPDEHLFGAEDRNTWCFYYQTADLSRQQGEWEQVANIYQQAGEAGYKAQNGVELIPFIEAYARTGQADKAADLTALAQALTPNMRNYTCDTWNRLAEDIQGDALFDSEYKAYSEKDLCWEVK